jgi:stearoyl-CoA desaturase (delta-9 desaturase)
MRIRGLTLAPTARKPISKTALSVEPPPHPWDFRTILVLLTVHLGLLFAPWTFSWSGLAVGLTFYALTSLGITLGYHRLLTHQSYRAKPWLARLLVFFASQSAQAGPAVWVAIHRQHHAHADQEADPHDASRGFWWSHLGWMTVLTPRRLDDNFTKRLARDVLQDPFYAFLDRMFMPLCLVTAWMLYLLGGWSWVVWGVFVRVAAVFHATWLVNSAAHRFGYRSFRTGDLSTNCWWVALLTFGEGWHNNHHAFPRSARHGLRWWEVDVSWLVLSGLQKLGWVEKVHLPSLERQSEARLAERDSVPPLGP